MQIQVPVLLWLALACQPGMAQLMIRTIPSPCQWLGNRMLVPVGELGQAPAVLVQQRTTRSGLIHERVDLPLTMVNEGSFKVFHHFMVVNDTIYRVDRNDS